MPSICPSLLFPPPPSSPRTLSSLHIPFIPQTASTSLGAVPYHNDAVGGVRAADIWYVLSVLPAGINGMMYSLESAFC
jgi:hypothetical protein